MDRPWMVAIEMQISALRACDVVDQKWTPEKDGVHLGVARNILRHAETYGWSMESSMAVRAASKTVPVETKLDSLPSSYGWWWFGDSLKEDNVCALAWGLAQDGYVDFMTFCYAADDVRIPIEAAHFVWKIDSSIRDLMECAVPGRQLSESEEAYGRSVLGITGQFMLAGCAWLKQRVVSVTSGHVERHRRKQLARESRANICSEVKVVQLRRSEWTSIDPDSSKNEAAVWSCRWIVNGHWRNQFHPSDGRHELKYIMPYVKGPEDMPLRVPKQTVYAVNR